MPEIIIRSRYARKKQPAQYETMDFELEISESFEGELDSAEIAEIAKNQGIIVKSGVCEQLGLEFEQNTEGVIMEVFPGSAVVARTNKGDVPASRKRSSPPAVREEEPELLASVRQRLADEIERLKPAEDDGFVPDDEDREAVQEARKAPPAARRRPAPRGGGRSAPRPQKWSEEDKWIDLYENPQDWWDNRDSKKNPKASDFAHKKIENDKGFKEGLWLDSDNVPDWATDEELDNLFA